MARTKATCGRRRGAAAARTRPDELGTVYPHRWAVPREVWIRLFGSAEREIAILAYSALFLAEDTGILRVLANKGGSGVAVRIALGDPDGPNVAERGEEEGIGDAMSARIRNALMLFRTIGEVENIEIRLHSTVLYNSIYRSDDQLLVNQHSYGIPATQAPVFCLNNTVGSEMTVLYLDSFERVWASSAPPSDRMSSLLATEFGQSGHRSIEKVQGYPRRQKTAMLRCMASPETPGMRDDVARACAWADELENSGRIGEARQTLRHALDRLGDETQLMTRLAMLERDNGHSAQAIELLDKVLSERPGDWTAGSCLARILLAEGKTNEAGAVIAALPRQVGGESGELAGEIFQALGQHALAVEAFGIPPSLSPRGRRLRRRSWWACGGPIYRGHRAAQSSIQAPELIAAPDPDDALLEVVTWAEWLRLEGRGNESRQVTTDALAVHGRHPRLLRCLAELEDSNGATQTALYLWCEAYRSAPSDIDIVCGLARQLSRTLVTGPDVWRFQEAVRILDAFPDRQDPKVRATRGAVFRYCETPPSRIVAAYGPARGLPAHAARDRRRSWWRSAGPLGQFHARLVDWRQSRWPVPADHPAPRARAESEEVARLLDSLDDLSPSNARERLEEAWQKYGRLPSLLLAHAVLDWKENADWQCLALATEAARTNPGDVEAACWLAKSVDYLLDYSTAVDVLETLPAATRQSAAIRVALGDLHRNAGNLALAATAYGDPRDLDWTDRRSRRRSVLRGLLQRRKADHGADRAPFDLATFEPVTFETAQVLDKSSSLQDSPDHGCGVLEAGIADHGRNPLLLLSLARAHAFAGDWGACGRLAAEAVTSAGGSPSIAAAAIRELWRGGFDTEALHMIQELPDEIRNAPPVRAVEGQLCYFGHLPCHAVLAFRTGRLDLSDRRKRRACWWRGGGPNGWLRRLIRNEERAVMSDWRLPNTQLTALAALPLRADLLTELQSDLGNYRRGLLYRIQQAPGVADAWVTWALAPTGAVLTALALTAIEHLRWPANRLWQNAAIALAVMAATGVVIWVISKLSPRTGKTLAIDACSAGAAAFLLQLPGQLPFAAGLMLATLALTITASYISWKAAQAISGIRGARWRRGHAVEAALMALLDLLDELTALRRNRNITARRTWLANLEKAAAAIERNLPHTLRSSDKEPKAAIAAHARGAAVVLRGLKRPIALADETSWDQVTSRLRTVVTALARGDLTGLPEQEPPAATPRPPRPWWWRAMQIARTMLVIIGPPLAAFLVPLTGSGVAWLRLGTLVWALALTIISLDPRIAEKVSQMREILRFWREAGSAREADGQDSQSIAGEQVASARRPVPLTRSPGTYGHKREHGAFRK